MSTKTQNLTVMKVWDAMQRGARQHAGVNGSGGGYNMPRIVGLENFNWYLDSHQEHGVKRHSGTGTGLGYMAQLMVAQKDVRNGVQTLFNRDNAVQIKIWLKAH